MTENEKARFNSIINRSRAVMNKVESTPRVTQRPSQTVRDIPTESCRVRFSGSTAQPELDYDEGDGLGKYHTDMAGNRIPIPYENAPEEQYMHYNEGYDMLDDASISGMQSDVNISSAMISAARQNSRLGSILDSFAENPLNAHNEAYDAMAGGSILDRLGLKPQKPKKSNIEEAPQKGSVVAAEVNYNKIQEIVETQLKRYATAISQSVINENKKTGVKEDMSYVTVGKDGVIKVITSEGKIYQVYLKYIGDVKKK